MRRGMMFIYVMDEAMREQMAMPVRALEWSNHRMVE